MKKELQVFIDADHGKIEASYHVGDSHKPIAIICHPHSLMGGTMDNKVVTTIARAFQALDFGTVRFNFRGVGLTSGSFDHGQGEQQDVQTVIDWAHANLGQRLIVLAGFSFGAFVATQYAQDHQLSSLLLVAPPVRKMKFDHLKTPNYPSYLIVAEADEVIDTQDILAWAEQQHFTATLNVKQASHFFHGYLLNIRDFILEHFAYEA